VVVFYRTTQNYQRLVDPVKLSFKISRRNFLLHAHQLFTRLHDLLSCACEVRLGGPDELLVAVGDGESRDRIADRRDGRFGDGEPLYRGGSDIKRGLTCEFYCGW
jgi:hypothetical protein